MPVAAFPGRFGFGPNLIDASGVNVVSAKSAQRGLGEGLVLLRRQRLITNHHNNVDISKQFGLLLKRTKGLLGFLMGFIDKHPLATKAAMAGTGAAIGIGALALMEQLDIGLLWLMAPFGATVVLLFAVPDGPLSQPRNIVGGHILTALIGLCVMSLLGVNPAAMALASGVSVALMIVTKTTHPPAGANPLVIMLSGQDWWFVMNPVASGALTLVAIGYLYHNLIAGQAYPSKWW